VEGQRTCVGGEKNYSKGQSGETGQAKHKEKDLEKKLSTARRRNNKQVTMGKIQSEWRRKSLIVTDLIFSGD